MLTTPLVPILSDTDKGQDWLNQFLPEEKWVALTLLENLHLISRDAFEDDLLNEFTDFIASAERPIAVFAVREVKANHKYFTVNGPKAVNVSRDVGSEGEFAHLVRDLSREYGVLDHPSIETMRTERVRNIVVLDDIMASGGRMRGFLEKIYADPTIKSWISGGKVRITAIVHSATKRGHAYALKGKVHWSIRPAHILGDLTSGLNQQRAQTIKELCKSQGRKENIPDDWLLGYNKTFSGVVFPHKCPNTAPGILWYNYNGHGRPLFNQRGSFDYPVWPTAISPEKQLRRIFVGAGQPTLADLEWVNYLGPAAPLKIAILALASRRICHRIAMAERLQMSFVRLNKLLVECIVQGWLTDQRRLTESGRAILSHAKSLGINTLEPSWHDPNEFYFLSDVGDHRVS